MVLVVIAGHHSGGCNQCNAGGVGSSGVDHVEVLNGLDGRGVCETVAQLSDGNGTVDGDCHGHRRRGEPRLDATDSVDGDLADAVDAIKPPFSICGEVVIRVPRGSDSDGSSRCRVSAVSG